MRTDRFEGKDRFEENHVWWNREFDVLFLRSIIGLRSDCAIQILSLGGEFRILVCQGIIPRSVVMPRIGRLHHYQCTIWSTLDILPHIGNGLITMAWEARKSTTFEISLDDDPAPSIVKIINKPPSRHHDFARNASLNLLMLRILNPHIPWACKCRFQERRGRLS